MKLLITGGAGFIGANFIHYWLKKYPQDEIINLDKLTYAGNLENLKDLQKNLHYKFVKADICDGEAVDEVMKKDIDYVINFAAETHVDRSIMGPAPFVKTNIIGTQVLLDAALHYRVKKFHHISTDEVFGQLSLRSKEKFNENTVYNPRSPYAASKAGSDHLVRAYFHTYKLSITITNCSNNFGPYQFPEKFIPLCITNALENKPIPIYGDGLYVRDWLYVEDHCRAIEMVLQKAAAGEIYCVGGNNERYNIDIARLILKILKKPEKLIIYVKDRPGHDRRYALDSSKIKKAFGWKPLYNFEKWLQKTIEWYQGHKGWWQRIKSREYQEYYKRQYKI